MDAIFLRLVKPVLVAALMFGSVLQLCGMVLPSLICALPALLLGWLDILVRPIYVITGLVFIAAVIWSVLPRDTKATVRTVSGNIIDSVRSETTPPLGH